MQFSIDNASNRPVYQQIVDQVKRDIALGRLLEGDKLPTVRQLAGRLVINPNTIGKAYRELERQQIIVTRPGAGAFIAKLNSTLSKSVRKKIIGQEIEHLAVEAVHMQIGRRQLTEWFNDTLERFKLVGEKE